MKQTLTQEEYDRINQLVEYALTSQNKKEAQKYINELQSIGCMLHGNARNIFGQMLSYVKNASGMVSDKESKMYFVKMELYKLEKYVVRD